MGERSWELQGSPEIANHVCVCMEQGVWCKTVWDWAMDGPLIHLSGVTCVRGDQLAQGVSWMPQDMHRMLLARHCVASQMPIWLAQHWIWLSPLLLSSALPQTGFCPVLGGYQCGGAVLRAVPQSPQLPVPPLSLPTPKTKSNFSQVTSLCRSQAHVKGPVSEQERATKSLFM